MKRNEKSTITVLFSSSYIIARLIVLCDDFEICLRMCAYWAKIWSLLTDYDMTTVSALPYHFSIS